MPTEGGSPRPHGREPHISQEASAPLSQAAGAPGGVPAASRATFGQVFALAEFRALWLAQVMSVAGDQLARVALTLLVFKQTGSALLAAVTFAASVVPTFIGGVVLSGLADRLGGRKVMIACDMIRAALVLCMIIPGVPVGVLVCLLFLVTLASTPFTSARAAMYADILPGDVYVLGNAVTLTTFQFAQVAGFAVGGVIVSYFGVRTTLLADAATFVLSAALTRVFVKSRPAPAGTAEGRQGTTAGMLAGIRLVFTDPALRVPMLFGWLAAFYNAPEGIAAPLAIGLGGQATSVGLLLASLALGSSIGGLTFSRLVQPAQRLRWMGPLAAMTCAVLILFVFRPPLPVALGILALSGLFDCYQVAASAAFVRAVPPAQRSQAFGIAQGGMSLGQGVAMILAGTATQHYAPWTVAAASGAAGVVAAVVIAATNKRRR